jgi:hypothetical protein
MNRIFSELEIFGCQFGTLDNRLFVVLLCYLSIMHVCISKIGGTQIDGNS